MKVAVIDLGTNTFHLIIADICNGEVTVTYKTNHPVRLGEGRINENLIIEAAFERGLHTLKDFSQLISKHEVELVKATATSAIRSAANGPDFVRAAKRHAGIDIDVISGDEEAAYIFEGVRATGVISQTSLIMDIGGGSTEFIICNENELLWKKSYNIGVVRLMQAYFHADPINTAEQEAIKTHLDTVLADLKEVLNKYQPRHLIGSAGAFESFASMLAIDLNPHAAPHSAIQLDAYRKLADHLIASTHLERKEMPGLIKLRVDMIVMAVLITDYIIEAAKITELSLSTYDLKMGVLYSLAASNATSSL